MIRQDAVSYYLVIASVAIFFYLETYGGLIAQDSLIGEVAIIAAFALERWGNVFKVETSISNSEVGSTGYWALFAFAGFFVLNLLVPRIPIGFSAEQPFDSLYQGLAFGLLMAIAEEQFFRAFFANFLLYYIKFPLAISALVDGIFFGVYHLAVYGGDPTSIIIVAGAGMIMVYADFKTQRVLTSTLAHMANNAWAFGIYSLFPAIAFGSLYGILASPLIIVIAFGAYFGYRSLNRKHGPL